MATAKSTGQSGTHPVSHRRSLEGVVDSNKGQLPQGSLQASSSPPPRHSRTQRGNCTLWQNILEHDVCGFFFFFLLNKWMCLGAAWEAEAPPTHLEALNSLKGPWSAEAREKGLLSASFVGKPPLAPAGPLSGSAGSSCSGGTSGRWVEGRPPFLQSSSSPSSTLPSLSLPRPQGSPRPFPSWGRAF